MIELKTPDDDFPKMRIKGSREDIAINCVVSFMAIAKVFSDMMEEPYERAMFSLFQQGMKNRKNFPDTVFKPHEHEEE